MTNNDAYIIEILKDVGLIKAEQIEAAKAQSSARKGVVDVLVESGVISKMEVLKTVAMQLGMDVIMMADHEVPPDVIQQVPAAIARRYKVVPVFDSDNTLTVALADPLNIETLDSLRYILKRNVEGVVASDEDISIALDHYYGRQEKSIDELLKQKQVENVLPGREGLEDETEITESDAPIIKLVSLIIMEARRNRASDIHLEPMEQRFRIRYRIDGNLQEVESPPKRLQSTIISRLKLMAKMKLAEKRLPQDGQIQTTLMGEDLDLRVSTVPTNHGESMVMRILSKETLHLGLPKLGFFADDQQNFEKLIGLADGIILITGPTGSGKTTTLCAILNHLNRPDRKIITVEDPVEYHLPGINQVKVREDIGLTFPEVLKAMLRQAPNIIMIGEIRDFATAEIAITSALTGHLVFSTLHTNDAPSAITRLLNMGMQPFLLASSIRATVAQRLVRVICEKCKEAYTPTEEELRLLGPAMAQQSQVQLFRGRGCPACNQTGYFGQKGIFEIFVINDDVRNMIFRKVSADELRQGAREMGMRTLREDGLRKVIAGITTLEEVLSITMGEMA
ncbi:MAG: Flp pilus assembly complex ATPase component TadA [Lentisphaerae bacterium]|nr:Flp pilus assembly complex ATPase component TadA [Lentisphaerota bacterium]